MAIAVTLLVPAYEISRAIGGQSDLGYQVSQPLPVDVACQATSDYTCGGPTMGTAAAGPGAVDLVVWSRFAEEQAINGVWARRIDARSGRPIGEQVHVAQFPDVGSVLAAYNPRSQRYLVLWQGLPNNGAMAGAINGQLLTRDLTPVGPAITVAAHDFYLYPGDLTANPADGDYLIMQLSQSHEQAAPHDVYVARVASDGTVDGTATWRAGTQMGEGQVHAAYEPESRNYLFAWLVTAGGSATFEACTVSSDLSRLGPVEAIAPGQASLGSDFSIAGDPGEASAVIAWLNQAPTGPTIVAQKLGSSAQPVGTMSTISTLADPPPLPDAGLGRLQLTVVGDHYVAAWQGLDQAGIVAISADLKRAGDRTVVDLPGATSTYSHATVANPAARSFALLSSSDSRSSNQIYARVVALPH